MLFGFCFIGENQAHGGDYVSTVSMLQHSVHSARVICISFLLVGVILRVQKSMFDAIYLITQALALRDLLAVVCRYDSEILFKICPFIHYEILLLLSLDYSMFVRANYKVCFIRSIARLGRCAPQASA